MIKKNHIQKCIERDRVAQKELYLAHKDRLMSVAYRYANGMEEAKDILQNGFIKIFTKLESFDQARGKFESWTTKIVINEALQLKRKRRIKFEDDIDNVSQQFLDLNVLNVLTVQELREAILKLPEKHRVVLNLFYFEQLEYEEIGELLNLKRSSVRAQLSRSRKLLEKYWVNLNMSKTI